MQVHILHSEGGGDMTGSEFKVAYTSGVATTGACGSRYVCRSLCGDL